MKSRRDPGAGAAASLRARWFAPAVAVLVAACASPPPLPTTVAPLTPAAAWQAPSPARAQPNSSLATEPASASIPIADASQWWAGFGDPVLPSLVEAARGASASLSAAAARIESARAVRVAAGAAMAPRLDGSTSMSRARGTPGAPTSDSASLGVLAGWELDLFGGRTAAREGAARRLETAQAQWHAARIALAAEVATSYVALRACEAQLEPAMSDSDSRAQTARLTEQSAGAGMLAPASAALARASAAQGRAQLVQQRAACEVLVKSLVALTAIEEPLLRQRLAPMAARQPQPADARLTSLPAALLQQRPDLVAATRQLQAAAADSNQAAAERWPQVSLSGSIGFMRFASGGAAQDGAVWSLGPLALSLPLFDAGRRVAQEGAARAAYVDAVVQLQAAVRNAVREVEDALVALDSVAAREADIGVATEGFEASLRAADARWRGGVGSLFELEDARRSALAAKSALVDLRRERATAWINLYRALGGGWSPDDLAAAGR